MEHELTVRGDPDYTSEYRFTTSGPIAPVTDGADAAEPRVPGEDGETVYRHSPDTAVPLWATHADLTWIGEADENDAWTVERVTSLAKDGDGTLAAALDAAEDNDYTLVVFEVGGVIDHEGETFLRSRADNVYIAGETAPYPGITLVRGGLRVHGSNHLVRHLTFLPGDDVDEPHKADAITVNADVTDVVFDHCAAGWAPDSTVSIHDRAERCAYINGINAEALNHSSHPEAPHGYALHFKDGVHDFVYAGNVHTHNWKRNPKGGDAHVVIANNYVYNWGARLWHGSSEGAQADWIGNVIEAGPDTDPSRGVFKDQPATVYWDDNVVHPDDVPMADDNIEYVDAPTHLTDALADAIVPVAELVPRLYASAGPRPADRAPWARRVVDEWHAREGRIIDHHDDAGGYPEYGTSYRSLRVPDGDLYDWVQTFHADVTDAAPWYARGVVSDGGADTFEFDGEFLAWETVSGPDPSVEVDGEPLADYRDGGDEDDADDTDGGTADDDLVAAVEDLVGRVDDLEARTEDLEGRAAVLEASTEGLTGRTAAIEDRLFGVSAALQDAVDSLRDNGG